MKPKLFPDHFNILLDGDERSALEALYDLYPLVLDEVEMLHKALRAGIEVLNRKAEQMRKDPHSRGPTRTEVEARMKSEAASEPRSVDNYVGFPVSDRLRARLEEFLATVAVDTSEEETYALLVERGLDSIEEAVSHRVGRAHERRMLRRALLMRLIRPASSG